MDILDSHIAWFSLIVINEISKFLPALAYFLLYKSFNNIWIRVAFYSELLMVILDFLKRYFMQWATGKYDENGNLVGSNPPSKAFIYTSYTEIALHIIFTISFLVFLYVIYRQKRVNKLDAIKFKSHRLCIFLSGSLALYLVKILDVGEILCK